jgi:hypothetical protein
MSLKLLRLDTRLLDARGRLWWEALGLRPHHLDGARHAFLLVCCPWELRGVAASGWVREA